MHLFSAFFFLLNERDMSPVKGCSARSCRALVEVHFWGQVAFSLQMLEESELQRRVKGCLQPQDPYMVFWEKKKKKVFCSHPREVTIYILPHPSVTKCVWVLRKWLNAYSHCLRSYFCKGFVLCNMLLLCFRFKRQRKYKTWPTSRIQGCSVAELCSAVNSRLAMIENSSVVLLSMSCGFLEWAAWLWGIHQSEGTLGACALPTTNDCIPHQYQAQGCKREDFSS